MVGGGAYLGARGCAVATDQCGASAARRRLARAGRS